jgi:hypothetical protein
MITRPIAACLRIVIPFLYLPSSPAAVTIWKPHHRHTIRAIRANIPKIQFTAVVIVDSRDALEAPESVVPDTHLMFPTPLDPQNQSAAQKS